GVWRQTIGAGGGYGPSHACRSPGAQWADRQVRRPAPAGGRLLVPRVYRFHAVVADCAGDPGSARAAAGSAAALFEADQAGDPVAAGTGASAVLPAPAERG